MSWSEKYQKEIKVWVTFACANIMDPFIVKIIWNARIANPFNAPMFSFLDALLILILVRTVRHKYAK